METCLQLLGVAGLAGSVTAAEGTFGAGESGTGTGGGTGGGYVMAGGRTTGVADPLVRDIAVQGLQAGLLNMELADYLLQLVQVSGSFLLYIRLFFVVQQFKSFNC